MRQRVQAHHYRRVGGDVRVVLLGHPQIEAQPLGADHFEDRLAGLDPLALLGETARDDAGERRVELVARDDLLAAALHGEQALELCFLDARGRLGGADLGLGNAAPRSELTGLLAYPPRLGKRGAAFGARRARLGERELVEGRIEGEQQIALRHRVARGDVHGGDEPAHPRRQLRAIARGDGAGQRHLHHHGLEAGLGHLHGSRRRRGGLGGGRTERRRGELSQS